SVPSRSKRTVVIARGPCAVLSVPSDGWRPPVRRRRVCATHAAPRSRRPGRWQRQQRGSWGVVLLAGCGRGKERIGIGGGLRKGAVFARGAAEKRSGP